MNSQDFVAVKSQLPVLRKQLVDSSHGRIPKSIEQLELSITNAASRDDKAALYGLILSECSYFRNNDLTLRFPRQQVRDLPDDPFPMTSLATDLARTANSRGEALARLSLLSVAERAK